MHRLIVLSGPSAVGIRPLIRAVRTFRPQIRFTEVPALKSYELRAGKLWTTDDADDFRPAETLKALQGDRNYIIGKDCRDLPQAVDLRSVITAVQVSETVLIKAPYTMLERLKVWSAGQSEFSFFSVFVSPVTLTEIRLALKARLDLNYALTVLMLQKQLMRAHFYGRTITDASVIDFLARSSCTQELNSAHLFSAVLTNKDGEGDPNWRQGSDGSFNPACFPEGDAGRLVNRFSVAVENGFQDMETWPETFEPMI